MVSCSENDKKRDVMPEVGADITPFMNFDRSFQP